MATTFRDAMKSAATFLARPFAEDAKKYTTQDVGTPWETPEVPTTAVDMNKVLTGQNPIQAAVRWAAETTRREEQGSDKFTAEAAKALRERYPQSVSPEWTDKQLLETFYSQQPVLNNMNEAQRREVMKQNFMPDYKESSSWSENPVAGFVKPLVKDVVNMGGMFGMQSGMRNFKKEQMDPLIKEYNDARVNGAKDTDPEQAQRIAKLKEYQSIMEQAATAQTKLIAPGGVSMAAMSAVGGALSKVAKVGVGSTAALEAQAAKVAAGEAVPWMERASETALTRAAAGGNQLASLIVGKGIGSRILQTATTGAIEFGVWEGIKAQQRGDSPEEIRAKFGEGALAGVIGGPLLHMALFPALGKVFNGVKWVAAGALSKVFVGNNEKLVIKGMEIWGKKPAAQIISDLKLDVTQPIRPQLEKKFKELSVLRGDRQDIGKKFIDDMVAKLESARTSAGENAASLVPGVREAAGLQPSPASPAAAPAAAPTPSSTTPAPAPLTEIVDRTTGKKLKISQLSVKQLSDLYKVLTEPDEREAIKEALLKSERGKKFLALWEKKYNGPQEMPEGVAPVGMSAPAAEGTIIDMNPPGQKTPMWTNPLTGEEEPVSGNWADVGRRTTVESPPVAQGPQEGVHPPSYIDLDTPVSDVHTAMVEAGEAASQEAAARIAENNSRWTALDISDALNAQPRTVRDDLNDIVVKILHEINDRGVKTREELEQALRDGYSQVLSHVSSLGGEVGEQKVFLGADGKVHLMSSDEIAREFWENNLAILKDNDHDFLRPPGRQVGSPEFPQITEERIAEGVRQRAESNRLLERSADQPGEFSPLPPGTYPSDPQPVVDKGNHLVRQIKAAYTKLVGLSDGTVNLMPVKPVPVDHVFASRIAKAYEDMSVLPSKETEAAVRASYAALNAETRLQFQAIKDAGYEIIFTTDDPYPNSAAMLRDLRTNKRLRVFASLPEHAHPYMSHEETEMFRAVHDFFGHATEGYQFGPMGEDNAWRTHAKMFSNDAIPAMTTETRGQNSWFNYGPYRDAPIKERPFAVQKANVLPRWTYEEVLHTGEAATDRTTASMLTAPVTSFNSPLERMVFEQQRDQILGGFISRLGEAATTPSGKAIPGKVVVEGTPVFLRATEAKDGVVIGRPGDKSAPANLQAILSRADASGVPLEVHLDKPAGWKPPAPPATKMRVNTENFLRNVGRTTSVADVKALPLAESGGATFNLNGTPYKKNVYVLPIQSLDNVTKEGLTAEQMTDFLREHRDFVSNPNIKVGVYKFEGKELYSIDLNVVVDKKHADVAMQVAKTLRQASVYVMDPAHPKGGYEMKTGLKGDDTVKLTAEQGRELAVALSNGELPAFMKKKARPGVVNQYLDKNFYLVGEEGNRLILRRDPPSTSK